MPMSASSSGGGVRHSQRDTLSATELQEAMFLTMKLSPIKQASSFAPAMRKFHRLRQPLVAKAMVTPKEVIEVLGGLLSEPAYSAMRGDVMSEWLNTGRTSPRSTMMQMVSLTGARSWKGRWQR